LSSAQLQRVSYVVTLGLVAEIYAKVSKNICLGIEKLIAVHSDAQTAQLEHKPIAFFLFQNTLI
jgi:hypothetical protein